VYDPIRNIVLLTRDYVISENEFWDLSKDIANENRQFFEPGAEFEWEMSTREMLPEIVVQQGPPTHGSGLARTPVSSPRETGSPTSEYVERKRGTARKATFCFSTRSLDLAGCSK
jgi:hypothetical protein